MNRLEYADGLTWISAGKIKADKQNQLALVAWMVEEGSRARWNPFDTTWKMPGSSDFNSAGVQNFVTFESGLRAFFLTIGQNMTSYGYAEITKALYEGGCACAVVEAVARSEWGTWRGDPEAAVRTLVAVEANFTYESQVEVAA